MGVPTYSDFPYESITGSLAVPWLAWPLTRTRRRAADLRAIIITDILRFFTRQCLGVGDWRLGIGSCFDIGTLSPIPCSRLPVFPPGQPRAYLLLETTASRLIVAPALQVRREVLLLYLCARKIVGILITLAIAQVFHQPCRRVTQVQRHRVVARLGHIL